MSEATIFQPFECYGGLADLTSLDEDVRLLWQLPARYLAEALDPARRDAQESEALPSYVAFVKNAAFNAAVRHDDDAVAAVVFAGVPLLAYQACRLFALRMDATTGLPACDDKERLIVHDSPIALPSAPPHLDDLVHDAASAIHSFDESTPAINEDLASFMFDISMRYVAMHECMHFALGHARYCQRERGLDVFLDGTGDRGAMDPLISQTLEFIADRHTVAGLVVDLDQGRLFHEWSDKTPSFVRVDPSAWRRRVLFATLGVVSRLWRSHGSARFGDFSQPYPHPYERVCWMASSIGEIEGASAHHEAMLAFALTVGSLDRNFITAREDVPVLRRDIEIQDLTGFSSLNSGYDAVRGKALEIQKRLYRNYGPRYAT